MVTDILVRDWLSHPRYTHSNIRDCAREAESRIARMGVKLVLCRDFSGLAAINERNREAGWFGLMPMFHPDTYSHPEAFWIKGLDHRDEPVMTVAARLYRVPSGGLGEEIRSLRLFYEDPIRMRAADELCLCSAPSVSALKGKVLYCGAGWCARDYRGLGFASIVPRISQWIGDLLWRQDYTISLVDPVLIEKGVVAAYGYDNIEPGVLWWNSPSQGTIDLNLIWMTRSYMLNDLEHQLQTREAVPA